MSIFKLHQDFKPSGDQPQAIKKLIDGIKNNYKYQTLLGVTGSGKTFTMANIIKEFEKPVLVVSHNKTLAAQLYSEFKSFFPENAVEYFVSYYDYYQPEAYVPQIDLYIDKEATINEDLARLRHSTVRSLLERKDVIVVASVSCIYGWDSPAEYKEELLDIWIGEKIKRDSIAKALINLQYERSEEKTKSGTFNMKGNIIEVFPKEKDTGIKIILSDKIEKIVEFDPINRKPIGELRSFVFFPAAQFVTSMDRIKKYVDEIREELKQRVEYFRSREKFIEAQRIEERTNFDLEMLLQTGTCRGIENYSRYFSGRASGSTPYTLLDFFPKDFLLFIDESHISIPQLRAMYNGDRQRKETLVEFGFRLESALDNRPLKFEEFFNHINQTIFVSATPSPYEIEISNQIAEQLIRPTGLTDPEIEIRKTEGQIDDLINKITEREEKNERVLVTTLTKKMSEDLANYLAERNIKALYLHSELNAIERVKILKKLRSGEITVIVGVNLLREGLDLPEVSLVAILDADKEGFLRSEVSLLQTMGRAARNVSGKIIMYADEVTGSMERAINEAKRRREYQLEFNKVHNITPASIRKAISDLIDLPWRKEETKEDLEKEFSYLDEREAQGLILELREEMLKKAEVLEFEEAARLRDKISTIEEALRKKKPKL